MIRRNALLIACALIAVFVLAMASVLYFRDRPARLLLAPMMALDACFSPRGKSPADAQTDKELAESCNGPEGSASALIESTLSGLQRPGQNSADYELGYTLNFPLLKLFKEQDGDWVIDKDLLGRFVRTLRDNNRPAIVYLFSTHFGEDAPIEEALAADPANLSWTVNGPLRTGVYYSAPIYNWSFASTRTAITARRIQAAEAVLGEICKLEPRHLKKIRGITLLGETHHLFPDFEAGMGFKPPYLITDYSETSKAGFRAFLLKYFVTIENFNESVGTSWKSFDEVGVPSKDIRTTPLRDFTEHIDAYAHGWLPISGWTFVPGTTDTAPPWMRIYRNGELVGRVPANMGRQDVLAAKPEFGVTNTGWRYDMDFRSLEKGVHRIDVFLEKAGNKLVHVVTRQVAIMDKDQTTPQPRPQKALPRNEVADASVMSYVDLPSDQSSYFFNPLVTYWHAFRALQVKGYIQEFNRAVSAPCLAKTTRFTHQIIPFSNPGWDETKFAIDASLQKLDGITLGVSLYGEPTYGTTFLKWLATTPHKKYGITEFHPLKALDKNELQAVFDLHSKHGAEFLSFFVEPRWKGTLVSRGQNLFSLDPANDKFGADKLYGATRQVLGGRPAP